MIKGKKIVITGGAGFIGSALAVRLANHNQVVLFDSLARDTYKHTALDEHPNVSLVRGDILNFPAVCEIVDGAGFVVHAAAIAGIDTVIKSPIRTM